MAFDWGSAGAGATSGAAAGSTFGPWGTAIGAGAGGLFGGLMGGKAGEGYKDAAKEFEKYWQQAQGYQRPFQQAGVGQMPILQDAERRLLDPSTLLADWMQKYTMSPYAKRSQENAMASGMDAASQMGLMGSSAALQNIQQGSSDIMNKDREGFLKDLMEKYMKGVGIGQDIYGKGAATAANLGSNALGVGGNMGEMKFGQSNASAEMMKNLLAMGAKAYIDKQNPVGAQ